MNYYAFQAFAASILIPATIGLVRFKKIHESYRPFLFLIWLASLTDIISTILDFLIRNSAVSTNIYVLLEFFLLLWQFRNWSRPKQRNDTVYYAMALFFTGIWIADNIILHSLFRFNSIFKIITCLVILFLSFQQINEMLFTERRNIFRNARFLLCSTFLVFFSYKAIIEVFYLTPSYLSQHFRNMVFHFLAYVNLIANLVYAIAILWIPKKLTYTSSY